MTEMHSDHDLTHLKLDKTREDVRRLHPLLHLLDPEGADITLEFAQRMLGLLVDVEERLAEQTEAFRTQTQEMATLRSQLGGLQSEMAFLMGTGDPEGHGSR